jgi:hypothetical protein
MTAMIEAFYTDEDGEIDTDTRDLADADRLRLIRDELAAIRDTYGDLRRTPPYALAHRLLAINHIAGPEEDPS